MKLRILGCYGGQLPGKHVTSLLLNDTILLDAGSAAATLEINEQHRLRHILLSHSHLDHIRDIPSLVDTRAVRMLSDPEAPALQVHAQQDTLRALKKHIFNNVIWPDFTLIPSSSRPSMSYHPILPKQRYRFGFVEITPIPMAHPVPCVGFLLDSNGAQCMFSADTGITNQFWALANAQPNLQAVIIDCSFPNAYEDIADSSEHLTPLRMLEENRKLQKQVPIYLFHMKPDCLNTLQHEINALQLDHVRMLQQGETLKF